MQNEIKMRLMFLNNKQRKKLQEQLEEYGIKELPRHLIQTGKEKIRAFSGEINGKDILNIQKSAYIEGIGLHILTIKENTIRITLDGLHILKPTKKIIELNEKQKNDWFKGKNIQLAAEKGFLVLKYKEDIIGMGKSTGNIILNYLPKERRIKN